MEAFELKRQKENVNKQFAVMELIVENSEGVYQNLIAICNSKEQAIVILGDKRMSHRKDTMKRYDLTYNEYSNNIDTDLDTVYDYIDEDGDEYHLLACTPA